jgi:nucleotide-binding universal stress UspA family protein
MRTQPRPIVVPLDGSANAELAVPSAVRLARLLSSPLRFIRVDADLAPLRSHERGATERAFEFYAGRLVAAHGGVEHSWSSTVAEGGAAEAIVEEANTARMIVMTTRGQGGLRGLFGGSVAEKVVRAARVPVLVVPMEGNRRLLEGPILVALDGSDLAEASLPIARDISTATAQPLVLLQAWNAALPLGGDFALGGPSMVAEISAAAEAYLSRVRLPGEETVALAGPAASAIRDAADRLDASMVVVSSHGKGRALRLALGSTTEILRKTLRRPLLVVPVAAAREQTEAGGLATTSV